MQCSVWLSLPFFCLCWAMFASLVSYSVSISLGIWGLAAWLYSATSVSLPPLTAKLAGFHYTVCTALAVSSCLSSKHQRCVNQISTYYKEIQWWLNMTFSRFLAPDAQTGIWMHWWYSGEILPHKWCMQAINYNFYHSHCRDQFNLRLLIKSIYEGADRKLLALRQIEQDAGWISTNLVYGWDQAWLTQSVLPKTCNQLCKIYLIYQSSQPNIPWKKEHRFRTLDSTTDEWIRKLLVHWLNSHLSSTGPKWTNVTLSEIPDLPMSWIARRLMVPLFWVLMTKEWVQLGQIDEPVQCTFWALFPYKKVLGRACLSMVGNPIHCLTLWSLSRTEVVWGM